MLATKQVRIRAEGYGEGVVKEFKKSRMFGASSHVVLFDDGGEQTVRANAAAAAAASPFSPLSTSRATRWRSACAPPRPC